MKVSSKLKAQSSKLKKASCTIKIERSLVSAGRWAWCLLKARGLTVCLLGGGALFYLGRIIALGYETATLAQGMEIWSGQGGDLPGAVGKSWGVRAFFLLLLLNLSARLLDQAWHWRRHSAGGTGGFWSGWTFRLGGLLFLLGLLVSMGSRSAGEIYLGEGQSIPLGVGGAFWSGYSWIRPGEEAGLQPLPGGLSGVSLQLEGVDPGLDGDLTPRPGLLLSHSTRAVVRYGTEAGEEGTQNLGFYPPRRLRGGYLFLTRFGFGPGVWVGSGGGREIYQGFQRLEIFPPGRQDSFTVPGLPYTFSLSLANGPGSPAKPSTGPVDPRHPAYRLRVVSQGKTVYQGIVLSDQEVEIDGWQIGFPETRFWVGLGVVKDAGLLWAAAGLLLILSGLISMSVCRLLIAKKGPRPPGGERDRGQPGPPVRAGQAGERSLEPLEREMYCHRTCCTLPGPTSDRQRRLSHRVGRASLPDQNVFIMFGGSTHLREK